MPSRSRPWLILGGSWLIGLLAVAWFWRGYNCSCTLAIRSTNNGSLQALAKALGNENENATSDLATLEREQMAILVLQSHKAQESANIARPPLCTMANGGIHISIWSPSADQARKSMLDLLDYHSKFSNENPNSRAALTARALDERMQKMSKELRTLETKLSESGSPQLQALGDAALKSQASVLRELWLRRSETEANGRIVLETLQRIREADQKHRGDDSDWIRRWTPLVGPSPATPRPINHRKLDFANQLRLERTYGDSLLKFRSLLIQLELLRTAAQLDSVEFVLVDPPYVEPQKKPWLPGTAVALVLGLISSYLVKHLK